MRIGKILLSFVAVVVITIAAIVWYALNNLNTIVENAVEHVGSDALKTSVSLAGVDIQLISGRGSLKSFHIANYPGFSQKNLIEINEITLDLDIAKLKPELIVIDNLTIDGVAILAEQVGTKTNLQALLDALPKSDSNASDSKKPSDGGPVQRFILKELRFTNNALSLQTEDYGLHTLKLPEIVQNDIGRAENGLTAEQLAVAVVKPLVRSAKERVEREVRELAKAKLKEKYGEKLETEKAKLKSKLKDKLGDDVESKVKNLKNLL